MTDKLVNIKPKFKLKSVTQPTIKEVKPHVVEYLYRLYIVSKMVEMYGYNLKDTLPTKYLENKLHDIIKSCQKFYQQLDKSIPSPDIEIIDDEMFEYFQALNDLMALNPLDRKELIQIIADKKQQRIDDGDLFEIQL